MAGKAKVRPIGYSLKQCEESLRNEPDGCERLYNIALGFKVPAQKVNSKRKKNDNKAKDSLCAC